MAYPIERKLVVGVSTTALFDLDIEDQIFKKEGLEKFKKYQEENKNKIIKKGPAFPFIKRFLNINNVYSVEEPVEVVLLSHNSPECGVRVFNSIKEYGLNISRAAFTSGKNPCDYIPAYNVSLYLSTNQDDVKKAIRKNYPAGIILSSKIFDDEKDKELRVAFDFDGVLVDDESEKVYQQNNGELFSYMEYEQEHKEEPMNPGLMQNFFQKLSYFQKMENKKYQNDNNYKKILRTAIATTRNAPAHERALNTLKYWEVNVDEMFLLGGINKSGVLKEFKPHLYIDDQTKHLDQTLEDVALVHIPFGIMNKTNE
jgi:5'-nucleotidase